jgi:hypothetical protein
MAPSGSGRRSRRRWLVLAAIVFVAVGAAAATYLGLCRRFGRRRPLLASPLQCHGGLVAPVSPDRARTGTTNSHH